MQQQHQSQQVQPQYTFEGGHLVMFHSENTGLPMQRDPNVNDRDRMTDLLLQEKLLARSYCVSMLEASHDQLFQVMKQNMDDILQCQRQLFNTMFEKGWYRLPVADAQSVAHTFNKQMQNISQLPNQSNLQQKMNQMLQGQGSHQKQQGGMQSQSGSMSEQKLNQQVQQALQQAQQGKVPTGVQ